MSRLRFLTAGESHGKALVSILEGVPAGLEISANEIENDLKRRQRGYGRGGRMQIEHDRAQILSGVRYGKTLGSPISLLLENKDWTNWTQKMSVEAIDDPTPPLQIPRPGHADFAGMVKFRHDDLRNILERSSARETAMRVAVGAIARKFLKTFNIKIYAHVIRIGSVQTDFSAMTFLAGKKLKDPSTIDEWEAIMQKVEVSSTACVDEKATEKMISLIDKIKEKGDTLGGVFEIVALGTPVGLGSHTHWDRRLDAAIAAVMMGINAIKSVEIGWGAKAFESPGSQVHDQIFYDKNLGYYRETNHAGGIEGGISNGQPIVIRVGMKPLATLLQPLHSVNSATRQSKEAFSERSDVCAMPAAAVVGEAMLAFVLADALSEKLGGDSMAEMQKNFEGLPDVPLGW